MSRAFGRALRVTALTLVAAGVVTGLEPEATSAVAKNGGDGMEDLTVYRKAFGLERHKGGKILSRDSAAGRCLVSWLEADVDVDRCAKAGELSRPER